jgi:hypothetical protein
MNKPAKSFKHPINLLIIGLSVSMIFPASVKAISSIVSSPVASEKPAILMAKVQQRIQFKKGTHSAEIKGGVARGTVNTYLIKAKKGQKMKVEIQSLEKNAVFNIIDPNTKTIVKESKSWSGKLSQTGDYEIVVGTERGGASYTMSISIE